MAIDTTIPTAHTLVTVETTPTQAIPERIIETWKSEAPTDPNTLAPVINEWLAKPNNYFAQSGRDGPYTHPKLLSFTNAKEKRNWLLFPDSKDCGTYSDFFVRPRGDYKVLIACFSTFVGSYVGEPDWDQKSWHAWGAAVINKGKRGSGKELVIWDCEPNEHVDCPWDKVLFAQQRHFVKLVRDKWKFERMWYNIDRKLSGEYRCLNNTMNWIIATVKVGNLDFQGECDSRVRGCKSFNFRRNG